MTLTTSDGMTGDLLGPDGKTIARIAKGRDFKGDLAAGRYAVEMRALGRDDRLDYTLDLRSNALQPDRPRFVELPTTIPFAIAQDRVVDLTTFGETQLTGVLRNDAGDAVERLAGRTDDWNLALSRRLPAGTYMLELAALDTPKETSESGNSESTDNPDDPPRAQAAAAEDAHENDDRPDQAAVGDADDEKHSKIEVRLALPTEDPARPLTVSGTTKVSGANIARFSLPSLDAETLLLVAAQADAEIVMSLERRDTSGQTEVAGFSRGRAPVIAMPVDAQTRGGWEIAIWPVDGGNAATTIAARHDDDNGGDGSEHPARCCRQRCAARGLARRASRDGGQGRDQPARTHIRAPDRIGGGTAADGNRDGPCRATDRERLVRRACRCSRPSVRRAARRRERIRALRERR